LTAVAFLGAAHASAQTTANLTVVKDATLRGGSYASTKHGSDPILVTRASDDATYVRRAALTFDTETTIPDNATIQSATLVLTVKGGNGETRQLGAYGLPVSFEEPYATWQYRNASNRWSNAGGDTTGSYAAGTVTGTVGSQTSFNVTQHVQAVLNGQYGSRYARFLVVDLGGTSRESYKEFHARESTDSSRRPRLIVTYGSSTTTTTTTSTTSTTTSGTTATPDSAGDITMGPEHVGARAGKWVVESKSGAINGKVVRHPNGNLGKIVTASASPTHYFEMSFQAKANTAYRLWLHGRADNDYWANDSVHVQFSGSVTSSGSATYRIGTSSSAEVNLEDCGGCGLSGWKWQDNGWGSGVLGPKIYFATTGTHKIRVQTREDGLAIDRIVLSPVTYVSTAPGTSPAPAPAPETEPAPAPAPSSSNILKVFDWNIHHGVGADGVYDLDRLATWIAKANPDVVSLNEVEKYTGWGNEDQPARFAALLKAKTGKTWYFNFATRNGATNGQGNLLLSRLPIESSADYLLSYSRSVAQIRVMVNGRPVNIFSTHLDSDSSSYRATQISQLKSWMSTFPEQRIVAGDFNAWPGASEIGGMTSGHYDTWAVAKANGTAVSFAGNEAGNTRNSRIDYVFQSKGATSLVVKACQVFDTRDSRGYMASDHRPLMTTFEVR
jgi:endonuclease/exonuclease/phosphatase family metal-dependent hydrolase